MFYFKNIKKNLSNKNVCRLLKITLQTNYLTTNILNSKIKLFLSIYFQHLGTAWRSVKRTRVVFLHSNEVKIILIH